MRASQLWFLSLLGIATVLAQGNRGSITGTVTDPAGAVVAGVKVEGRGIETGALFETVTTDTGNAAITTAIIALAGAMGLEVVAEGVETQLQADFLRERGCHRGQGYLFGKPVPVTAFENFLRGDEIVEARAGAVSAGVPV